MPALAPFSPAGTASLSVTATTGRVARAHPTSSQIRLLTKSADKVCFVNVGSSTVTAAVTDTPILPGVPFVMTVPNDGTNGTYVAAICASTETATLYITDGEGQ